MSQIRARFTARQKFFVLLTDTAFFLAAMAAVSTLRFGELPPTLFSSPGLWASVFVLLSALYILGTYDLDDGLKWPSRSFRTSLAALIAVVGILTLNYLLGKDRAGLFGRGVLLGSLVVFSVLASLMRGFLAAQFQRRAEKHQLVLLADAGLQAPAKKELDQSGWTGRFHALLPGGELAKALDEGCDALLLAGELSKMEQLHGTTLLQARLTGTPVMTFSRFIENHSRRISLDFVDTSWFVMAEGFALQDSILRQRLKRLADVGLSLILLAVAWPFMILTALLVKIDSKGPALFSQIRTGKDGRPFTIHKFRSMRTDAEKDGAKWATANDDRVTRSGKFIRKTRLDELPQLWNVLRGDMSFVGPRPERPEFNAGLAKDIPFYDLRHLVRPGITGWAQVMYPYGASVEDARRKLEYELFYIKNYSLWLDFKIVLRTIRIVLFARGR